MRYRVIGIPDEASLPFWIRREFVGMVLEAVDACEIDKTELVSFGDSSKVQDSAIFFDGSIIFELLRKKNERAFEWCSRHIGSAVGLYFSISTKFLREIADP